MAVAAFLSTPDIVAAKEQFKVKTSFENTAADPDAEGSIKATFKGSKSKMKIKLRNLDPNATYSLKVGGIPEAEFTTKSSGQATLQFKNPPKGSSPALDFDPRGKVMSVNDGVDDVLETVSSIDDAPDGTIIDERTDLTPTKLAPGGKAEARFRYKDGRSRFKVQVEDVPSGDYQLFVGGIERATITVNSAGRGEVEFDSQPEPGKLLLDFGPRGLVIDVLQGGDVYFSGVMAAKAEGISDCEFSEISQLVASTGVDPDGKADARFRIREDCDRDFRVEIEDVPTGDYELFVGGVNRGTITVTDIVGQTEGQIEFDTDPDDPDERLLDFDPRGQLIEIKQGATIFFSEDFDTTTTPPSACTFEEAEVPLFNSGIFPQAKGKARFRMRDDCSEDFRVEIEDLPVGDYDLLVGGVNRGAITVTNTGSETEGQIEFDTDPDDPDELPLTFDPRGELIEIERGGDVVLSRPFPAM
jgi:hypothetical protein